MKRCAGRFSFDRGGIAIGVLFLTVAAALTWNADASFGFGPDQLSYNIAAEELLETREQGLAFENEFGSPLRQSFALLLLAGRLLLGDLEAGYRLILFLSACAYLLAMYVLLASVLENRTVAALTAVLSIVQRYTIGTSFWGMGEFQAIIPRIVVLAVFPLAWLHFERHLRSRRVLESFVLVALGFTIHLSAVYFYCILLLTYGLYVVWSRAWSSVLNLAVATIFFLFAVKAVPSPLWSYVAEGAALWATPVAFLGFGLVLVTARHARGPWIGVAAILFLGAAYGWLAGGFSLESTVGFSFESAADAGDRANAADRLASLNRALYARFGWSLFPISLGTLGFALLNGGILGAVAIYELICRWRLGATERERVAVLYLISVIVVSLGITGALQLYCRITGRPDIVLEFFRAFRFIYLPLYIYLGLFLERQWRQTRARGGAFSRLMLAVLIAILLLPPRQALAGMPGGMKLLARSAAEKTGILHPGDPSQSEYLYTLLATRAEREQARARHRDFVELCDWVRRSTPEDGVFLTTDYSFTYYADRDIMISYQQGAGSARSMAVARGHRAWHKAYLAITGAFASRSPGRILAAAHQYGADYVVTSADQPPLPGSAVYANPSYSLYRVADRSVK